MQLLKKWISEIRDIHVFENNDIITYNACNKEFK